MQPRFRLSLEQKLPLAFAGLLLAIVLVLATVAYDEVRDAAWESARARLRSVAREMAENSAIGNADRLALMRRAAASRDVLSAAETRARVDSARAIAALGTTITSREILWAALLDGNGAAIADTGQAPGAVHQQALRRLLRDSTARQSGAHSPYFAVDSTVYSWSVVPIVRENRRLGFLALYRRLGVPPLGMQRLRAVSGADVTFYFANASGDVWAGLDSGGRSHPTSSPVMSLDSLLEYDRGGKRFLAASAPTRATPWALVVEEPLSSVLERPRSFLRHVALSSLALVAICAMAAWWLSRRMTHPLGALTRAADAVAAGDYAQRVQVSTTDELGRMAAAFNAMAQRIEEARAQLRQQVVASGELAHELEEANRAKADFLAVVSHELRTPLNAIAGYVDLMELGLRGPLTDDQKHDLARIRRNQHHLMGIITSILNFARIDAREMQYEMQSVPLSSSLREVAALIEPQVRAKGVTYVFVPCEEENAAWADPQRLEQIVLNLLSNAVRFTAAGGRITLSCGVDGTTASIRVTDTGIGIPHEKLRTIFDPFVQVESGLTRRSGGTGLGLAISRGLARGMGGEISASSEEGTGSTFTLTLARSGVPGPSSGAVPETTIGRHVARYR